MRPGNSSSSPAGPLHAEPAAAAVDKAGLHLPGAGEIDFTYRADPADLPEWMDEPCTYEQFRGCVRDIGTVNRLTFAYWPTLRFLQRATQNPPQTPLRVLDVGSGGGDTLRRLVRWAARRKLRLELTGIDLNPHATRAALEFSSHDPRFAGVHWITGDLFTEPAAQHTDLVLSSLVTHHMHDAEIVNFLKWMERTARHGWFINDLLRSSKAYRFFRVFSTTLRFHPFVQHDGPVSIRRAFREPDWHRLLAAAAIPADAVQITQPVPGRLCLTRLR